MSNEELLMKLCKDRITDELDRIARKYGTKGTRKIVDMNDNVVRYDIDLGGHMCGIMYVQKHLLMGGLKYGKCYLTKTVRKQWKKVVAAIENDIIVWRHEHPLLVNEVGKGC